jgi:Rad3-related DNA helicases
MPEITREEIEDFFEKGGILSKNIEEYECRQGQIEMATVAASLYNEGGIKLVEAGTGIGKSFAYLYPAVLNALKCNKDNSRRVTVVATSSITLQNQLFEKDLPAIIRYLNLSPDALKYSLMLGRSNYFCIYRYVKFKDESPLFQEGDFEHPLNKWAAETKTGLKTEIQDRLQAGEWNQVCSDSELCPGRNRCPYVRECFYYKAYEEAAASDIIITNQHLLMLDSKIRNENLEDYDTQCLLPPFHHLVIDEAHNLKEISRQILSSEFSGNRLKDTINSLFAKDEKKSLPSALRSAIRAIDEANKKDAKEGKEVEKNKCSEADKDKNADIFEELASRRPKLLALINNLEKERLKLKDGTGLDNGINFVPEKAKDYESFLNAVEALEIDLSPFSAKIGEIYKQYGELEDVSNGTLVVLQMVALRLDCALYSLSLLEQIPTLGNRMYFMENESLIAAPADLGSLMSNSFFGQIGNVLCCSATLTSNSNFDFFINTFALGQMNPESHIFLSPFDYVNNMKVFVPSVAPEYSKDSDEKYQEHITGLVKEVITASNGGALVLFTSYSMLGAVYKNLKKENFFKKHKVYCQNDQISRNELLNCFKTDLNSSLFAVSSFWEGVDIPGESLRVVLITKLPFISPFDPVYHGLELLFQGGGRSTRSVFFGYSLPTCIISTKQGIGRLIRTSNDRGIIVICDRRIVTKNYSRQFRASLPVPLLETDDLGSEIESFFNL